MGAVLLGLNISDWLGSSTEELPSVFEIPFVLCNMIRHIPMPMVDVIFRRVKRTICFLKVRLRAGYTVELLACFSSDTLGAPLLLQHLVGAGVGVGQLMGVLLRSEREQGADNRRHTLMMALNNSLGNIAGLVASATKLGVAHHGQNISSLGSRLLNR